MPTRAKELRPRYRVIHGKEIALGPGKVKLLRKIQEAGSIAAAAEQLGMSYMRAWTLIKTTERCFKDPLIKVFRGGPKRGGAELTDTGKHVLELYDTIQKVSMKAVKADWEELEKLLRD